MITLALVFPLLFKSVFTAPSYLTQDDMYLDEDNSVGDQRGSISDNNLHIPDGNSLVLAGSLVNPLPEYSGPEESHQVYGCDGSILLDCLDFLRKVTAPPTPMGYSCSLDFQRCFFCDPFEEGIPCQRMVWRCPQGKPQIPTNREEANSCALCLENAIDELSCYQLAAGILTLKTQ